MPTDDFSNYPIQLNAKRAELRPSENLNWTPRDALIWVLKKIDSGEYKPCEICIVWGEMDLDDLSNIRTGVTTAGLNCWVTLGLLETAKDLLLRD